VKSASSLHSIMELHGPGTSVTQVRFLVEAPFCPVHIVELCCTRNAVTFVRFKHWAPNSPTLHRVGFFMSVDVEREWIFLVKLFIELLPDLQPDLPPDLHPDLPLDLPPDLIIDLPPDLPIDLIPDLPIDLPPDLLPDLPINFLS
jgi:hypothetical protein